MIDLDEARAVAPYAYLATPYSKYPAGIDAAFRAACRATGWLIERGVKVYCPIAHTHPVAIHSGMDPYDHSIWLPADTPFMHGAGGIIVCKMPTWEQSKGIAHEIEVFERLGKPVLWMEWPLVEGGAA